MAATTERFWAILDSESMPPAFDGVVDTSDYVPDEEAIKAGIEKNKALIASYGEEFEELLTSAD
ncbi:MAG: hypothetical protein NC417_01760 [Candidatus Gastranaerophilales bacterium]|nr:hypothetical protein [Candidatus Gastranaerophilales bacterium]